MKCTKCGAEAPIDPASSLCPSCLQAQRERSRFKVALVFLGGVFVVIVAIIAMTSGNWQSASSKDSSLTAPTTPAAPATAPAPEAATAAPAPDRPNWDYNSYQTNAGSKTVQVGCIDSDEMVHLNAPYEDTSARLCLRTDGAAILMLNGDGQLLSGEEHGAIVRIGNGPARHFSLDEPADYSSNKAFIEPASPLFAAAKAGKPITIQATYYEAGDQTTTFSPSEALKFK